ncbi:MAG: ammonia-forming cytochrome c nitrite reductase subunit c552, partial [Planctomycetota bacterium]
MRPPFFILTLLLAGFAFALVTFEPSDPRVLPARFVDSRVDYSNVLPSDYVGPDACIECHATHHQQWQSHPHSRMNQQPSQTSVLSDFEGTELHLPDATAHFTTEGDRYLMTITKAGETFRRYVVTRTVGSRYMQYFIGKQLEGPESSGHPVYDEHMLPFAYWFELKRWFPRRYFDADGDEELCSEGLPLVEAVNADPGVRPYTANCMNCHNTFPYVYRIFHKELVGFPKAIVSASINGICQNMDAPSGSSGDAESFRALNAGLNPDRDLVTLGISCESCHFGAREHVQAQRRMRYLPTSPFVKMERVDPSATFADDGSTAATINGICSQCHSGDGLRFPEGAVKTNSSEGYDLQKGFCASKISCVNCHDPHAGSEHASGFQTLTKHVDACLECHPKYADPVVARSHSGHAASDGVSCLDCHMPRYNQGVNGLSRTHRICMPVEEQKLATSGANACNVCHVDKSLRWTLNELKKGWNVSFEPGKDWALHNRLDDPVAETWLNGSDNHMRFVATECLSRSPQATELVPLMLRSLNDPEPLNRAHGESAIRRVIE